MVKRIFASAHCNVRYPVLDWGPETRETADAMDEQRGGGGDELSYAPSADTFTYALGSGCAPTRTVPNPVPGDAWAGAQLVSKMADADWGVPQEQEEVG